MDFVIGIFLSCIVLIPAYLLSALTLDGLIAGIIVGTCVYTGFGFFGFVTLLFFFLTGSILSKVREKKVIPLFEMEKQGKRDLWQVLANGGVAMISAILYVLGIKKAIYLFIGTMATVTADTWATELGLLSGATPRNIINLKRIAPGMSGGVTVYGTIGGITGASAIGVISSLFYKRKIVLLIAIIGGIFGFLLDSILGATVQRMGYCRRCNKFTEKVIHGCGERTKKIRGINFLNNDWVNFLSSFMGGVIGIFLSLL